MIISCSGRVRLLAEVSAFGFSTRDKISERRKRPNGSVCRSCRVACGAQTAAAPQARRRAKRRKEKAVRFSWPAH